MIAEAINCLGFTWASSPAATELESLGEYHFKINFYLDLLIHLILVKSTGLAR
jgi:hypothetical protein